LRVVDYISAACLLLRRADFMRVLGFDLAFEPAYYEEVDLCMKLRLLGKRTYYVPNATVTHIENASSGDSRQRLLGILAVNKQVFAQRWAAYLNGAGRPPYDLSPSSPTPQPPDEPRMLFYSPAALAANDATHQLLAVAHAMRGRARMHLITPAPYSRLRLLTLGRDWGLDLSTVMPLPLAQAPLGGAAVLVVFGDMPDPAMSALARRTLILHYNEWRDPVRIMAQLAANYV
jgi:hypothetical protein